MPNYFYINANGQKQGLINDQQLQALAAQGVITPNTPLETEGGHKGTAGQIPGLQFTPQTAEQTTYYSPQTGSVEVAEFLLAHGANVNAQARGGTTPLHVAVYNTERFYNRGKDDAKFANRWKDGYETVKFLVAQGADVNAYCEQAGTPLHMAIDGNIEVTKFLVSKGANVNARDPDGITPLFYATEMSNDRFVELIKFLVSEGADVNVKTIKSPGLLFPVGTTPLHPIDLLKSAPRSFRNKQECYEKTKDQCRKAPMSVDVYVLRDMKRIEGYIDHAKRINHNACIVNAGDTTGESAETRVQGKSQSGESSKTRRTKSKRTKALDNGVLKFFYYRLTGDEKTRKHVEEELKLGKGALSDKYAKSLMREMRTMLHAAPPSKDFVRKSGEIDLVTFHSTLHKFLEDTLKEAKKIIALKPLQSTISPKTKEEDTQEDEK